MQEPKTLQSDQPPPAKSGHRNVWLIVVAVALLLCCSCAISAAALGLSVFHSLSSSVQPAPLAPVIVVTRAVTATPAPVKAEGPDTEAVLARAEMPPRDMRQLTLQLKPGVTQIPIVVNSTPPVYKVGDTARFQVSNNDTQEHQDITAELRYITDHVYMWVEEGVDLDQADLEASAKRFEKQTYPTNREFFGSEWTPGVDDDVHLSILHARGLGESTAGYYSSADEYSRLVNPYSNEREMFYISADGGSAAPNSSFYDGTLAHEFQHMIHWANDRNEDSWVNEGMSELAGFLNGFDPGGADIAFSEQPDTQLTTWSDPSMGNLAHYGASYLFMMYFLDRFGEDLTKAVVASPKNGIAGFNEALANAGRPERFNDIFADWVIANYLDRPEADPRGRFGYSKIDPAPPTVVETYRRYPASAQSDVSQYATDYIKLEGNGPVTITFQGQPLVSLVDTQPKGTYAWWSNRGDDSDSTLTRAFDLRDASTATLHFSTWYDIEDGWDYAYVEASADGGKTWKVLPGQYTTDKNPVGNAFGVGWTGISGGGEQPKWVAEQVDLTPFAGKEVLLRFQYVTDDAVNNAGFMLDDISIPELGYQDDGERGPAGWEAAGWVLTDNTLSEDWLVQLIEVGKRDVRIERMEVGADGKGQLNLDNLGNLNEAVLAISALAPVTTEKATYNYTIAAP
jgi:immune inhibitor A